MILHIIKKDLRLLWPFVVGLTTLNVIAQWARYGWSVHGDGGWPVFGPLALIAWVLFVTVLVHQDVIPGTRQDWLTRPIKRRDLVAAKLLFVVGLLHVPLFVMMTIEVLAAGYSLADAVGGAFVRSLSIFIVVSLPTLAIAAVSRNLIEAIIVALVVAFAAEPAAVLFDALTNEPCGATCGSSLNWVGMVARVVVVIVAAVVVIALQYFKRGATSCARGGPARRRSRIRARGTSGVELGVRAPARPDRRTGRAGERRALGRSRRGRGASAACRRARGNPGCAEPARGRGRALRRSKATRFPVCWQALRSRCRCASTANARARCCGQTASRFACSTPAGESCTSAKAMSSRFVPARPALRRPSSFPNTCGAPTRAPSCAPSSTTG